MKVESKLKYLNVGCGKRFHQDWLNIDVLPADPGVIHCDVTKGLPFENESLKVVYHSHVLEHIPKSTAKTFMSECFRVLEPGGVIRIAVPDLEGIIRNYLRFLDQNIQNPTKESKENYEWMMLELYDQVVRDHSGGEMQVYLQSNPGNKSFVLSRLGEEVRPLLEGSSSKLSLSQKLKKFNSMSSSAKMFFVRSVLSSLIHKFLPGKKYYQVGKFRSEGEIHQWMYDQYSLKKLLEDVGFKEVHKVNAFESSIPEWSNFNLDGEGEVVFKPDSLFMEGIK
ncbi:MAG: methyltransferase domain-containing protein [Cyclobacteriaceae bacterium]|nr:methyltransferase domain-containing protein [Cyclobacteriaceae bacterium SS2]